MTAPPATAKANTQPGKETPQGDASSKKKWKNNKSGPTTKNQSGKGVFKGAIAALNGNVYEVHNEAFKANQFQKTTKAIAAFANRTMKHGNDMRYIIENMEEIDFDSLIPTEPNTGNPKVNEMMLQQAVSLFMKRKDLYEVNKNALYTIIWNQCSEALQAKLEGTDDYEQYAPISCPISLLKHIKQASLQFENVTYTPAAVDDAKVALYSFFQPKQDSLHEYYLKFKDLCDALEHYGADVGYDLSLVQDAASRGGEKAAASITSGDSLYAMYKPAARERYLALRFLRGADRSKYGDLVIELENDYSKGGDYFPSTVAAAYTLLKRYKKNGQNRPTNPRHDSNKDKDKNSGNDDEAHTLVFVNKDGRPIGKDVSCFDCGGNHYKGDPNCPKNTKLTEDDDYPVVSSSLKVAFVGAHPSHIVQKPWILLDNQSSVHIFKDAHLVTNMSTVPPQSGLLIHSNGGSQFTNKVATHPDIGPVWFNSNAITNIMSFSQCKRDGMHIEYDTVADVFTLVCPTQKVYTFSHVSEGQYAHDFSHPANAYCASTVQELQRMFTPRQIAAADKARQLHRLLGRPSERVFKHMISNHLIQNTDVTVDDINRAAKIYGPDIGTLKGKTVRTTPNPVRLPDIVPLPADIKQSHTNIELCVDICHVDGLRFLTSISRHLHFATIEFVPSIEHDTLSIAIRRIVDVYHSRGFVVTWILTDRAFEHLRDVLASLNIRLNVTAANEHVPEVERLIRVIKERARGFFATYPVSRIPNIIKIHLFQHIVQMLNLTVQPNGVSSHYSPATIVIGTRLDTKVYCRLEFGSYCQVHDDTNPRNDVHAPRTLDAISLRPIGNAQGGYYFLCLTTWRVIARRQWTVLPMPVSVIDLLSAKSQDEVANRPQYLRNDHLHFRRADRTTITSLDDDDSHLLLYPFVDEGATLVPTTDTGATVDPGAPGAPDYTLDTDDSDNDNDPNAGDNENDPDTTYEEASHENHDDDREDDDDVANDGNENDTSNDVDNLDLTHGTTNGADDDDTVYDDADDADDATDDDDDGVANSDGDDSDSYVVPDDGKLSHDIDPPLDSLQAVIARTSPAQRNSQAKNDIHPDVTSDNILHHNPDARPSTQRYSMRQPVMPSYAKGGFNLAIACTQMTAKEGLKRFGQLAEDALLIEWKQLDNLKVYNGVYYEQLTPEQRTRVLRLIQLIKLKRSGLLKGRTCADGRKQRGYIPADDATSPTVSTEALLMTLAIDAREQRKVVTADVPGAFLHAKMDDIVHVVVEGEQLRILLKSNPAYKMYVHTDPKTKRDRLYLKLNKALYGTLKAARLFFDDLTKHLQEMGFTANPYDPCVMNKNIKGSQCTIAWHVDDIKISHKRQDVIEDILKKLQAVYGELSITRGTKHTFVGMDIEFKRNKVEIFMKPYLQEALEAFPEDTSKKVTTPAADHLYTVNPNSKKLPESLRECFHHIVAKLLFVATRGRPDLQPTISFLTSRCAKADEDDWKKLKRLLCYIRHTIDLKLILKASAMNVVMWWADAAFAVRDDFKSQSGRGMSLGTGMIQCKSNKQSTTENSSTTAELISSSDALVMIIWTSNFLKAQGYPVKDTILFQDNMSAIKLEKNGRQSSSKRTRHLDIRHFFIKDRVQSGELNIKHCGTNDMIADYFTKPLQGAKFIKFRDLILGMTDIDSTDQIRSVLEEDLKWPNLNNNLSDDKRPIDIGKNSQMESPMDNENYERARKVRFNDSS